MRDDILGMSFGLSGYPVSSFEVLSNMYPRLFTQVLASPVCLRAATETKQVKQVPPCLKHEPECEDRVKGCGKESKELKTVIKRICNDYANWTGQQSSVP